MPCFSLPWLKVATPRLPVSRGRTPSTETLTPTWELENEVLTIKGPSDKPCRLCKGKEKTVEVTFRDKTYTGVMCTDCIYKEIRPEPRVAKTA